MANPATAQHTTPTRHHGVGKNGGRSLPRPKYWGMANGHANPCHHGHHPHAGGTRHMAHSYACLGAPTQPPWSQSQWPTHHGTVGSYAYSDARPTPHIGHGTAASGHHHTGTTLHRWTRRHNHDDPPRGARGQADTATRPTTITYASADCWHLGYTMRGWGYAPPNLDGQGCHTHGSHWISVAKKGRPLDAYTRSHEVVRTSYGGVCGNTCSTRGGDTATSPTTGNRGIVACHTQSISISAHHGVQPHHANYTHGDLCGGLQRRASRNTTPPGTPHGDSNGMVGRAGVE